MILIDRTVRGLTTHFVGSDDHRIGELATEHLIAMGKKRVAHIRGPENSVGDLRFSGYRDALAKHGMKQDKQHIVSPSNQVDTDGETRGARAMVQLLAAEDRPDAIFCFNDLIAVGALSVALEAGVRVPAEMAFIGCGNYYYGRTLQVPLSSIDQKVQEFGRVLAKLTLNLIGAEGLRHPQKIVLNPELVVRRSSRE